MAVSAATRAFVVELFDDLGRISARGMMGGLAVYSDGRIFAMVSSDDRIWVKADGDLANRMAAEGSEQFGYERRGGVTTHMGYWSLPEAALDDQEAACDWALRSLAASAG